MEHTEGLGREAEVWLGGDLLTVCDGISSHERLCPPGVMEDIKFSYVTEEAFTWEQAIGGNPSEKKLLEPQRQWSYVGYGRIAQVMPVLIDFGLVRMEDSHWTADEGLVGRFVRIAIDRLEIGPAHCPDWPEGIG